MKTIRGIYITPTPSNTIEEHTSNGIARKQYYHVMTFREAGMDMDILSTRSESNKLLHKILSRSPIPLPIPSRKTIAYVASHDFMYVRNELLMSGFSYLTVKRAKKANPRMRVVLEIPTYPYDHELRLKAKDKIRLMNDRIWRKDFIKYVDRIATYSRDDVIWGKPTIRFSNAIVYDKCKRGAVMENLQGNVVEIIACAQLSFWHGYDRAIKGLVDYYKANKARKYDIIFHVVGGEPPGKQILKSYKDLVNSSGIADRVVFHGWKSGAELDAIYNRCVIGLDSMGRHRSGVFYNSSLKGKEYLAKGLMVVSGVETELDYDNQFPYYIRIPADETPVDFFSILDRVDSLLSQKSLGEIQRSIMTYAKEHFDYSVTMNEVVRFAMEDSEEGK